MSEKDRKKARQLAEEYLAQNNPTGWFEPLYSSAEFDDMHIPWADMDTNPNLLEWLEREQPDGQGKRALVIGCGLGDDAEELARRGFEVTAFDISPTAVAWCKRRFPQTSVSYIPADLLQPPKAWQGVFDFVLESYTLQVFPPGQRTTPIQNVAAFVAEGGTLLVICRGRDPQDDPGQMPWPLTREELSAMETAGLRAVQFEDYLDTKEGGEVRRFRIKYERS